MPRGIYKRKSTKPDSRPHDAIVYLRHAKIEIEKQLAAGKKLNRANLYALLALDVLQS